MTPHALRPLETLICALAEVMRLDPEYHAMTEAEFVAKVMQASGGQVNPRQVVEWRNRLRADLGLDDRSVTG